MIHQPTNSPMLVHTDIMGDQVVVPITAGKLDLGRWEQVFYAELDGRRKTRIIVKVMGI